MPVIFITGSPEHRSTLVIGLPEDEKKTIQSLVHLKVTDNEYDLRNFKRIHCDCHPVDLLNALEAHLQ